MRSAPCRSRAVRRVGVAAFAAALTVLVPVPASYAASPAPTGTRVIKSTTTFTVPAGVAGIQVRAWGAGGGGAETSSLGDYNCSGGAGGAGGMIEGNLTVAPGDELTITVGQGGASGTQDPDDSNVGYPGKDGSDTTVASGGSVLITAGAGKGGSVATAASSGAPTPGSGGSGSSNSATTADTDLGGGGVVREGTSGAGGSCTSGLPDGTSGGSQPVGDVTNADSTTSRGGAGAGFGDSPSVVGGSGFVVLRW